MNTESASRFLVRFLRRRSIRLVVYTASGPAGPSRPLRGYLMGPRDYPGGPTTPFEPRESTDRGSLDTYLRERLFTMVFRSRNATTRD